MGVAASSDSLVLGLCLMENIQVQVNAAPISGTTTCIR